MKHQANSYTLYRGFSLLELSVVLAVIAMIAGAGMTMATGALKAADRIATQERLITIKTALDNYAKTHGYLPCPFNRTLPVGNAAFGIESRSGGNCNSASPGVSAPPGLILNSNTWFGGIPVRTLGLPDSYAADAWGNKLTYAVSGNHINTITNYATQAASLSIRNGDRTTWTATTSQRISGAYTNANDGSGNARITLPQAAITSTIVHFRPTTATGYRGSFFVRTPGGNPTLFTLDAAGATNLPFNATDTGGTAEWLSPGPNATYVVISHGPDGRGGFPLAATAIPVNKLCNTSATANSSPAPCTSSANTSCIDIENCNDNDTVFFDTAYNDGAIATKYFDDFIIWGTNALMRAPVNTSLYNSCGTNPCEPWCAACSNNYPAGLISTTSLCKKVLTSNSTTCNAHCFWAGTTASGYQKCP